MKKISEFVVNKRLLLFICTIIAALVCIVLSSTLKTNTDMSKYLSDDSNMKQGLDIMDSDFPAIDDAASIRVMFNDLDTSEIDDVKKNLEALPNVSGVEYEAGSKDFNKDNHTLFIINTEYDYDSAEEKAIEEALSSSFSSYDMTFHNNDIQSSEVPPILLISALATALIILIIMSRSWLEPVLFMVTIGIAVLINLGTNIVFPYTSDLTSAVAPIIQLALSMDYSIILMNRYRLEKLSCDNKYDAMKAAFANSFSSIVSSSLTTVVGLLAIVFLTFKIGPELGIVLAKGVFISMTCVFTILPSLILWFEKGVEKSKKKSPHIPMDGLAVFSHKARFVIPVIFSAIFIMFYIIQSNTRITFTEGLTDSLSGVFPKENSLVMIYDNRDEDNANKIISEIENDKHIKNITAYGNTLGKGLNAADMSKAISQLGNNIHIDKELVSMVCFLRSNGELPTLSAPQFFSFLKNDILTNPTLSESLDDSMKDSMDEVEKYTDKNQLIKSMNAQEMAAFLEMDSTYIEKLYLYFFSENSGIDSGKMTLSEFSAFVLDTVAFNEEYSSMFDESDISGLQTLRRYTNTSEMTKHRSYKDTATILGMDAKTMKMLYVYYQTQNVKYNPPKMTLAEFILFMQNDVVNNPMFSSYIDETMVAQLAALGSLTDGSIPATLSTTDLESNPISNTAMSSDEIASFVNIDKDNTRLIFTYWDAQRGVFDNQYFLSVSNVIDFIISNETALGSAVQTGINELKTAQTLINSGIDSISYNPSELAGLVSMDESQIYSLYLLYLSKTENTAGWVLTPQQFIDFTVNMVLPDKRYADFFNNDTADKLKAGKTLIDAVISETNYPSTDMYTLMKTLTDDITQNEVDLVYVFYGGKTSIDPEYKITIPQMLNYLCDELVKDKRFSDILNDETIKALYAGRLDLDDAIAQIKGKQYSRLIFTSDYAEESTETNRFITKLNKLQNDYLSNDSYLVGTSAMVYEMETGFAHEFLIITLITAVAIFLVVLLAFRNFIIPLLLTLLVQCGVFITVSAVGINGGTMYYLALLIVQSILMGATIDYGIVLSTNYRESRQTMSRLSALKTAYNNSIHTIMTSGSILILVTGILGIFSTAKVTSQVCMTISIGSLIAVLLILLVLPGILDFCDRFIVKKKGEKRL